MKSVQEIEPNVDLIEHNGRQFYLIGTAHVSRSSADLVARVLRELRPDTVCLELDSSRYESLRNPKRWQETDLFQVIRGGKAYVLMAQLALAGFQRKIAKQFGIKPGQEMLAAMGVAEDLGLAIELVDRDVRVTLKRAWSNAGLWSLFRMAGSVIVSLFVAEELTEKEIENLKQLDEMTAMMAEFSQYLPGVKEALIDERDLYMAHKIVSGPGKSVVAVLGAGHIPGIKAAFGENIDISPLEKIPPPRLSTRLIMWGIPLIIISMITYGFARSGFDVGSEMVGAWFLVNGGFSALGALIALAHPLTILTAFVAAPFTSLNPAIAAGWVAGLVETYLRKPRVKDLETIGDDVTSLRGVWHNRFSRILLVIALANLGSAIGTFVGFGWIASLM